MRTQVLFLIEENSSMELSRESSTSVAKTLDPLHGHLPHKLRCRAGSFADGERAFGEGLPLVGAKICQATNGSPHPEGSTHVTK